MNVLSALCPPDVANPQAAPFMGEDFLQIGLAGRALSAGERGGRTKPSFFVVSIILKNVQKDPRFKLLGKSNQCPSLDDFSSNTERRMGAGESGTKPFILLRSSLMQGEMPPQKQISASVKWGRGSVVRALPVSNHSGGLFGITITKEDPRWMDSVLGGWGSENKGICWPPGVGF